MLYFTDTNVFRSKNKTEQIIIWNGARKKTESEWKKKENDTGKKYLANQKDCKNKYKNHA